MMSRTSIATCAGAILMALLLPGMSAGQASQEGQGQDRHKWWLSGRVQQEVGITPEQAQTLEAVFQAVMPELRAHKAELDRFEREVSELLTAGTATEAQVTEAVARTEAARAALYRTRTLMVYRMYRVLSAEQRVKLQGFHKRLDSARTSRRDDGTPRPPR
jgi:Spy/CpxP family protein refolding chaperone